MTSVVADVLVLVATWTRTWPMRAEAARINFTSTFAIILMRDGGSLDVPRFQIDTNVHIPGTMYFMWVKLVWLA